MVRLLVRSQRFLLELLLIGQLTGTIAISISVNVDWWMRQLKRCTELIRYSIGIFESTARSRS